MNSSKHEFVWWLREPVCGSEASERGIKIHGTPLGHPDYVAHQLQSIRTHQQTLLNQIPTFRDVQSAQALLLHCEQPAPIISSVLYLRTDRRDTLQTMTRCCGDVCVRCRIFPRISARSLPEKRRPFRWRWVGSVCAALFGLPWQRIGQAGRIHGR